MKKGVVGGVLLTLLTVLAFVTVPAAAQQQDRSRTRTAVWDLSLGLGSTIGVTVRDQTGDAAGVVVEDVRAGAPAAQAGVQKGDVIIDFDGERARSAQQFARLVRETPPGRTVKMTVTRNGSRQTLDVTPEERDSAWLPRLPEMTRDLFRALPRDFDFEGPWPLGSRRIGISVVPLSDQLAAYFGVKDGVLVSQVESRSPAADAGIQAGDVITAVNGRSVYSTGDIVRELREAGPGATLDVQLTRDRKEMTVKVTLPDRRRPPASRTLPI